MRYALILAALVAAPFARADEPKFYLEKGQVVERKVEALKKDTDDRFAKMEKEIADLKALLAARTEGRPGAPDCPCVQGTAAPAPSFVPGVTHYLAADGTYWPKAQPQRTVSQYQFQSFAAPTVTCTNGSCTIRR